MRVRNYDKYGDGVPHQLVRELGQVVRELGTSGIGQGGGERGEIASEAVACGRAEHGGEKNLSSLDQTRASGARPGESSVDTALCTRRVS